MSRFLTALALVIGLTACAPSDSAEARQSGDLDREAIEAIVRAYLVENPEVIEEALIELQRRRREAERTAQLDAIAAMADRLYGDARDPVVGARARAFALSSSPTIAAASAPSRTAGSRARSRTTAIRFRSYSRNFRFAARTPPRPPAPHSPCGAPSRTRT